MLAGLLSLTKLRAISTQSAANIISRCHTALVSTEYETLRVLYDATDGEEWWWANTDSAWNFENGSDPCEDRWEGITCASSNTSVVSLDLFNYNMQGTLPSEIGTLTSMEYLNFGVNELRGAIPSSIGQLHHLTQLHLYQCYFTSTVPSALGSLTNLFVLRLQDNNLMGTLPASLSQLSSLYEFDIHANLFSQALPTALMQNMPNLRDFHIQENEFTGAAPSFSGNPSISRVSLFDNLFSGSLPASLFEQHNVLDVELSRNMFSGALPQEIYQCTSLVILVIHENALSGTLSADFSNLTNLLSLVIRQNHFYNEIPVEVFNLTNLQLIMAQENLLSGSLPDAIVNLNYLNVADNFYYGGLPELISPYFFIISDNYFTGTLSSVIFTPQVAILELASNIFTGTISPEIVNCSMLYHLHLPHNYISGTLPATMLDIDSLAVITVAYNLFSGSVPSLPISGDLGTLICNNNLLHGEVGNLENNWLENINLNHNMLTGRLPEEVNWPNIIFIAFSDNFFSGIIPLVYYDAFKLDFIDLSNNFLVGTLPADLRFSEQLRSFNVHANLLTGMLPRMYNDGIVAIVLSENRFSGSLPLDLAAKSRLTTFKVQGNKLSGSTEYAFTETLVELLSVDLSDNQFTGRIPALLFKLPRVKSIALVKNCFEGEIPNTICHSSTLQVAALDGLASACKSTLYDPLHIFGGTYLSDKGFGTIPNCIWDVPSLTTLHLSGNGLTGNIENAKLKFSSSLSSLSLSHNRLTGSIPSSFVEHLLHFQEFDVSHNRFSGLFDRDNANNGTLRTENEDVALEVNRFSGYISKMLGKFDVVKVLNGNLFQCTTRDELPTNDPDADIYICGSSELDSALWVLFVAFICFVVCGVGSIYLVRRTSIKSRPNGIFASRRFLYLIYDWMIHSAMCTIRLVAETHNITTEYVVNCKYVSVLLMSDIAKIVSTTEVVHVNLFVSASLYLLRVARMVLAFILMIVLPSILALKTTSTGSERTQEHQYRWLVSCAYMSGTTAAATLYCLWFAIVLFISYAIYARHVFIRSALSDIGRLASASTTSAENNSFDGMTIYHISDMLGVILLNMFVVFIVNGAYIYIQLNDMSETVQILSQISLAAFKLIWDTFAVGAAISWISNRRQDNLDDRTLLYTALLVFNNIIAPCFVTAVTDDTCFKGLFEEADTISVKYTNTECFSYAINSVTLLPYCDEFIDVEFVTSYVPPFNYNYQCSSAILKSFIPVFIYAYAFMILALPVMDALICTVGEDRVPLFVRSNLAGVMWPRSTTNLDKPLIRVDRVISTLMRHLAVLVTFGFSFPLLGVGVVIAMIQYVWKWRLLIIRYISIISVSANVTDSNGECTVATADVDKLTAKLNDDCQGSWRGAYICLWAVIWPGAIFMGCLLFDILGDEVGWQEAIWLLILVGTSPVICWVLLKTVLWRWMQLAVSDAAVDVTVSPLAEIELARNTS